TGEPGLAGRAPLRRRAAAGPAHPRGRTHHPAGGGGARPGLDADGAGAELTGTRTGLGSAVDRYLDHLAVERGLAGHTLDAYRRDLTRYQGAMSARGRAGIGEGTTRQVAAHLARPRRRRGGDPPPP